jgi:carbon monoxide dehydrogenase subunit G
MTVHIEESVSIARPPSDVWAAIADYSFDTEWRAGLEEMTPDPPGPPAVGTRVREVVKFSSRSFVTDAVVTELDPGVSYQFEGSGTSGGVRGGRRVGAEDGGDGATFTYAYELEPRRPLTALGPLLAPLLRSGLKKDLRRLKALLENGGPASA